MIRLAELHRDNREACASLRVKQEQAHCEREDQNDRVRLIKMLFEQSDLPKRIEQHP